MIKAKLTELLRQPEDELRFVVVEDRDSEKFVQFTGSISQPLVLDLPWQTLSEAEFYGLSPFSGSGELKEIIRKHSMFRVAVGSGNSLRSRWRCHRWMTRLK